MNDIVVDTNVLVQTNNTNTHYNRSATETLHRIQQSDLKICVDDVFNIDESKNTSVIGHEYIKHVRAGTLAYAFLLERIKTGKIVQIYKKDFGRIKRKLSRKIINREMTNTYDIAFVITAYGSSDKILVSNDYADFNEVMRNYILKKFSVSILDSDEYVSSN
jgi:predicted nucleic acid-binding protein